MDGTEQTNTQEYYNKLESIIHCIDSLTNDSNITVNSKLSKKYLGNNNIKETTTFPATQFAVGKN